MKSTRTVILVDADNTLWDTDSVYRSAQLTLLSHVESELDCTYPGEDRLGFVRDYDQKLALAHHLHLRYPPQLLVRALASGLDGVPSELAARDAIEGRQRRESLSVRAVESISAAFVEALSARPPLLPQVREAISAAQRSKCMLYVMTEGRIERQRSLLELYGLREAFEGVWEMTKNETQFQRLLTRFPKSRVCVIGDQLDRDIAPAKAAGCVAVFVPSRFTPTWNANRATLPADFVAENLLQAIEWCVPNKNA